MVYRLVYKVATDVIWVQYGAGNANRRPHFLPIHHTEPSKITIHPTVESALAGIERFEEIESSAEVKIQFANDRHSEWTYIVDEDAFLGHIDKMIMC